MLSWVTLNGQLYILSTDSILLVRSSLSNLDSAFARFERLSTQSQHEVIALLQRTLQGQTHTTYYVESFPLLPENRNEPGGTQAHSAQDKNALQTSTLVPRSHLSAADMRNSALHSPKPQMMSFNANPPRLLEESGQSIRVFRRSCSCSCHKLRYCSSPLVFVKTLGRLVVGVSGYIFNEPICSDATCQDQARYSLTVTYYFPSWLIAKAIILRCTRSPYGEPSIGVHVRSLLPEHSPTIRAITEGQIETLKSLFQERISTPNAMEEMSWTTLTVSYLTTCLKFALTLKRKWAIHKNQVATCKFLLDAGADPTLHDGFGK